MMESEHAAFLKRKSRKHHHDNGLCEDCGKPSILNQYRCQDCKNKQYEIRMKRQSVRLADGLCKFCDNIAILNTTRCKLHTEKHNTSTNLTNYLLKKEVMLAYGGVCSCIHCPERNNQTLAFLTIDHINNDGAKQKREMSTHALYRWLKKNNYPNGYRVLCWNCNSGRHLNNGICPHERFE